MNSQVRIYQSVVLTDIKTTPYVGSQQSLVKTVDGWSVDTVLVVAVDGGKTLVLPTHKHPSDTASSPRMTGQPFPPPALLIHKNSAPALLKTPGHVGAPGQGSVTRGTGRDNTNMILRGTENRSTRRKRTTTPSSPQHQHHHVNNHHPERNLDHLRN